MENIIFLLIAHLLFFVFSDYLFIYLFMLSRAPNLVESSHGRLFNSALTAKWEVTPSCTLLSGPFSHRATFAFISHCGELLKYHLMFSVSHL